MDFLFDVEQELSQGADPDVEVAQIQAVYGSKKRTVVCKHWLRGLCKKGEMCDYLHEFDKDKMPPCQFFFGENRECNKPNCPFKHTLPSDNMPDCPWFSRGFCKKGPFCKLKHVKKKRCVDYADFGFCRKGPECKFGHPKFEQQQPANNPGGNGHQGGGGRGYGGNQFGGRGGGRGGGGRGGGRGNQGPSWKCAQCNNVNYPFRMECNRCHVQKPANAELVENFQFGGGGRF